MLLELGHVLLLLIVQLDFTAPREQNTKFLVKVELIQQLGRQPVLWSL